MDKQNAGARAPLPGGCPCPAPRRGLTFAANDTMMGTD